MKKNTKTVLTSGMESSTLTITSDPTGSPAAILHISGAELSERQQAILDKLPAFRDRAEVSSENVSMSDLSALTARTGVEYSMFTKNGRAIIERGVERGMGTSWEDIRKFGEQGYTWEGHTHVGRNLIPSANDFIALNFFLQRRSYIFNSYGESTPFEKKG